MTCQGRREQPLLPGGLFSSPRTKPPSAYESTPHPQTGPEGHQEPGRKVRRRPVSRQVSLRRAEQKAIQDRRTDRGGERVAAPAALLPRPRARVRAHRLRRERSPASGQRGRRPMGQGGEGLACPVWEDCGNCARKAYCLKS